ncbi:MAG: SDR family NAD(P)-dependent oxidoreductase [Gammaproteobacteria bacterium]|nr:SDR family NAD(P)-dependent oxidoreductase [Rhodospirillaceae bacterium]MDE0364749.1 SDR family NAD(P)-dependent oxidoreductase [Gammaproteobacteria bacterium]
MSGIDFSERVALVTGGAGGIGSAVARVLRACGTQVALTDVDAASLESAAAELGGGTRVFAADISSEANCERIVGDMVSSLGSLDILVNCAALPGNHAGALAISVEDWQRTLDVNLRGTILMSRFAGRWMVERQRGAIINVSAISAQRSFAGDAAYTASKAGIEMVTKTLACQWGAHGVRVNCVSPGSVDAGMGKLDEAPADSPIADAESFLKGVPLRRAASADEVAWPIAFLASDLASYVNGAVLVVDGGFLAC